MVDRLWLLEALAVPVARPDPNTLATGEGVIPDPHHRLSAELRPTTFARLVDHPPALARLGIDGVGVVLGH
jgi:hypothetical protein